MTRCPKCAAENPDRASHCSACGARIEAKNATRRIALFKSPSLRVEHTPAPAPAPPTLAREREPVSEPAPTVEEPTAPAPEPQPAPLPPAPAPPPPPPPTVLVDWAPEASLASSVLAAPYPLVRTSVVTIGRAEDSNIVMPVHQVSRRHALIKWDGEGFVVIDQRSTNGTYVNGESVQRRRLEAGDVIGVGPFELVFSRGAPRPPAERDDSTVVVAIPGAFSGELSEVSVPEICQLIELNQKTGVLVFHQGTQRGKVHFKAGRAVHAEFRDLLGDDAATELLSLTRGSFRFLATTSVHVQTTIKKPTALLLLEAAQRADEKDR